ncbi:MAG: hypothetical protein P857_1076 [Candidatus Xenolissoclinum pacificiensis L6]|uniref:Uncharacterized protein n=1 Tax=Candidatus Xenolissoclinum pacificiensis L6 TaxID=1401685 RepID=W2V0F0_9RICK|nr:MAG: hypothetical protein P857_1076 [Candidatus Xenolissoclinum pacificiensis L6]
MERQKPFGVNFCGNSAGCTTSMLILANVLEYLHINQNKDSNYINTVLDHVLLDMNSPYESIDNLDKNKNTNIFSPIVQRAIQARIAKLKKSMGDKNTRSLNTYNAVEILKETCVKIGANVSKIQIVMSLVEKDNVISYKSQQKICQHIAQEFKPEHCVEFTFAGECHEHYTKHYCVHPSRPMPNNIDLIDDTVIKEIMAKKFQDKNGYVLDHGIRYYKMNEKR